MKRKTKKIFPDDIQLNSDVNADENLQMNESNKNIDTTGLNSVVFILLIP